MRINLNEFLTDAEIHTLWGIAGRIIDSGAIMDNQDYEISLSLLSDGVSTDQKPVEKVSQARVGKDMDLL
tara:strand:- start:301 stop:510 length:210 start_codon:yes stop_codon:yes gene_type:complete